MFSIVEFLSESGVISLVPSTWVNLKKTECNWPPFPPGALIKKCKVPNPSWPLHSVLVIEEGIDSYEKGRRHEKKAALDKELKTTDAETPKSRFRSKQKSIRKRSSVKSSASHKLVLAPVSPPSDEGSSGTDSRSSSHLLSEYEPLFDEDELQDQLKQLDDKPSSSLSKQASSTSSGTQRQSVPTPIRSEARAVIRALHQDVKDIKSKQEALEKLLIKSIAEIKADLKDLLTRTASQNAVARTQVESEVPVEFPLKTETDLNELNQWLHENVNRNQLLGYFSAFGGKDGPGATRKVLKTMFSEQLAKATNYTGQNGKIHFQKYGKVEQLVKDSVRLNFNTTHQAIEVATKNWFLNSRDLSGGQVVRKGKKNDVVQNKAKANQPERVVNAPGSSTSSL